MSEKQKIALENKKLFRLDFGNNEIMVNPYISLNNKVQLVSTYIDSLFSGNDLQLSYISAEYSIILGIVDLCTDIDITDMSVDTIISSGLWDEIVKHIENYYEFKDQIDSIVKMMREDVALNKSIGVVVDNMSTKFSSLINKILEVDFSQDGINKLIERLGADKVNNKEYIPVTEEVKKTPRKRKSTPKE